MLCFPHTHLPSPALPQEATLQVLPLGRLQQMDNVVEPRIQMWWSQARQIEHMIQDEKRCLRRPLLPGHQGKSQRVFLFPRKIFIVGSLDDFRIKLFVPKATLAQLPHAGQRYPRPMREILAKEMLDACSQHPGWRELAGVKSSNNSPAYRPGHKKVSA